MRKYIILCGNKSENKMLSKYLKFKYVYENYQKLSKQKWRHTDWEYLLKLHHKT